MFNTFIAKFKIVMSMNLIATSIYFALTFCFAYAIKDWRRFFKGASTTTPIVLFFEDMLLLVSAIVFLVLLGIKTEWWMPLAFAAGGFIIGALLLNTLLKILVPNYIYYIISVFLAPLFMILSYVSIF